MERAQARALFDTERAVEAATAAKPIRPQLICAETGAVLCWECNEPIPAARLAREPTAGFCVSCLSAIEQRRKARREN